MFISRAFVLTFSLAMCAGASAQQMYKTVGEDGKVTFSDRPKLESAAKLSVMRSYTLRPMKTPGEAEPTAEPGPAVRPVATPLVQAALAPQVETAVMAVMTQAEFSRRFYPFCNTTQASARTFTQAASAWKKRNADAVDQQRKLLMQVVSPARRTEMQDKVAASLAEEAARIGALPAPERAKWCAAAVAEMASESSDINQPEMMAVVIKAYKK